MSQQAEDAKARGLEEQVSAARKNKQLLGQQRAMMAANGVDLSSATPMEMFTQTAEFGEEDRQTIIDNTNREVWAIIRRQPCMTWLPSRRKRPPNVTSFPPLSAVAAICYLAELIRGGLAAEVVAAG